MKRIEIDGHPYLWTNILDLSSHTLSKKKRGLFFSASFEVTDEKEYFYADTIDQIYGLNKMR